MPEPEWTPRVDPWEWWSPGQVAEATACPGANVSTNWPILADALAAVGLWERPIAAAMIGTVAIETASTFEPVREAFWLSEDWRRANLRYYPFYGRGYIQLTWEANYRRFGTELAELWGGTVAPDMLVSNPEMALEPFVSAACAALYFQEHGREDGDGIPEAAMRRDWREVRRLVQGGSAGLDRFVAIADALMGPVAAPAPAKLSEVLALGRSRIGDPYVWDGEQPGGFDCSGFVKWCYGGRLTSFTDAVLGETERVEKPAPGDIVLYEYKDEAQPGVRFPHMGLFLSDTKTLDARVGFGVGEHDQLPRSTARRFYRRLPGVVVDTLEAPVPVPPAPVDELAALRAENERLRTMLGYASTDIAGALRREIVASRASLDAAEAAVATLERHKP